MKRIGLLVALITLGSLLGCVPRAMKAPQAANGKPISLCLVMDRGIHAGMNDKAKEEYNTVGNFMAIDFIHMANKAGYQASLLADAKNFHAAPSAYLLKVRIRKYNPGSKAARILIGFGAGAVSLDTHYELSANGKTTILSKNDGVGSSVDWPKVVMKLNQKMLDTISTTLAKN